MRRLILMRHGEAEAARGQMSDRDRALTAEGIAASVRCAQEIRARGFSPDQILSSDALRATMTLKAVVQGGDFTGVEAKTLSLFYLAEPETIILRCCEVDNAVETLLLIGHNPGWSDAATQLCGKPMNLGTAQAALLEHKNQDWTAALYDSVGWRLKAIVP